MNLSNVLGVARLDTMLLWRNRTALFTVIGMPLLFGAMLFLVKGQTVAGLDAALYSGTGYLAFFLVFAVFMNLVNVFTARREDLTLKRLRGGVLSDAEVLAGSVVVAAGLFAIQAVVLLVVLATALGGRFPANPPLLVVGLLLGTGVFALLAFAVSGLTPSAEMAQLTVVPLLFVSMAGSGVIFPLDGLPDAAQQAAGMLPLTPVVETVRTAYFGRDFTAASTPSDVGLLEAWAACFRSFAVFGVWACLGIWSARRWFRWEPRSA